MRWARAFARLLWCGLLAWCGLVPSARADDAQAALRRFAFAIAADDGGPERVKLRYAKTDARTLTRVLEELGGVASADVTLLTEPRVRDVQRAFAELGRRIASEQRRGTRTELVFYYSGHSDEQGLLLGGERLSYVDLRALLAQLPVDVRIAILDSCASGAITRLKGGVRRPPFLFDVSTQVRGHAFLTSSSADEAAQESDRVGGSFFTHYLVSGLRGAADASGDRRVTLAEAYRFAFDETLARTGQTQAGAQHPTYDIQLAGTGDLVITDLRSTSSELAFDADVYGRLFVRDHTGALTAELYKTAGRVVTLALPSGLYTIELLHGARRSAAVVETRVGKTSLVRSGAFHDAPRELARSRGDAHYEVRTFAASLIPPYSTNPRARKRPIMNHLGVAVLYDDPDVLEGVQLSFGGAAAKSYADGVQFGFLFNRAGDLRGVQFTLGVNGVDTHGEGVQFAGLTNYAGSTFSGAQAAWGVNFVRRLHGAQLAWGMNAVSSEGVGFQGATVNWASALSGGQLGGLNIARDLTGAQIGFINVASGHVHGLQLGVVNYADRADVSLGLLGITREGGVHAQLSTGDTAMLTASLRLDAQYNYSFVAVGWHPLGTSRARTYLLGAGLGVKIPVLHDLLYVDSDLGAHIVQPIHDWHRGLPNTLFQLRLMARVEVHKHFSVFLGPTMNALMQLDPERRVRPGFRVRAYDIATSSDVRARYWPGWVVGLRL